MKALVDLVKTVTGSFTFNAFASAFMAGGIAIGIATKGLENFGEPALMGAALFVFIGDAAEALKKRGGA